MIKNYLAHKRILDIKFQQFLQYHEYELVVTQGTHVESGCIYAGTPAKKIKEVDKSLFEGEIMRIADNYLKYSGGYKE